MPNQPKESGFIFVTVAGGITVSLLLVGLLFQTQLRERTVCQVEKYTANTYYLAVDTVEWVTQDVTQQMEQLWPTAYETVREKWDSSIDQMVLEGMLLQSVYHELLETYFEESYNYYNPTTPVLVYQLAGDSKDGVGTTTVTAQVYASGMQKTVYKERLIDYTKWHQIEPHKLRDYLLAHALLEVHVKVQTTWEQVVYDTQEVVALVQWQVAEEPWLKQEDTTSWRLVQGRLQPTIVLLKTYDSQKVY